MTKTIEDLFFYAVFAADFFIIALILYLLKVSALKNVYWFILFYCIYNSLSNYLSTYLVVNEQQYFVLVLFTTVEYLLFAFIFSSILKNERFKRLIFLFSFIFVLIVIFNYNPSKGFDSLSIGIETILIMIYCFYYLYEQMNDLSDSFIYNRYHFWIAIGILIYLGGSFFIYIFADKIDAHILDDYWFLTYAFYIIKNIFFAVGIASLIKHQGKQSNKLKTYSTH